MMPTSWSTILSPMVCIGTPNRPVVCARFTFQHSAKEGISQGGRQAGRQAGSSSSSSSRQQQAAAAAAAALACSARKCFVVADRCRVGVGLGG